MVVPIRNYVTSRIIEWYEEEVEDRFSLFFSSDIKDR